MLRDGSTPFVQRASLLFFHMFAYVLPIRCLFVAALVCEGLERTRCSDGKRCSNQDLIATCCAPSARHLSNYRGSIGNPITISEKIAKNKWGMSFTYTMNLKYWKGQKLRRNIKIPKKLIILQFYDLGPNGNYRESLKTLHVVSRMPAGLPPKTSYTPGPFL